VAAGSTLVALAFVAYRSLFTTAPPNLLLVTLDTLRADRLGCYGYKEARTPNLDRLASEGVRFETAVAQVPLTLPSHTTLFTGTYPARHGMRDNGGYFLSPELTTLAELAREAGYRTGAFISAFVLDSKWGLDRGFDTYYDQFDLSRYERISLGSVERIAEHTVEEFLPWLETMGEAPFFAWVHLYDPHAPYEAPEPFGSEFEDRPYDGEVAYVDAAMGRVMGFLHGRGLDETTIVVVAGDHGEGLGDHRELTHGNFVYDSTLRVPLILRFPDQRHAGLEIRQQVGLIDLFVTLAELVGATVPDQNQGRSLLPLLHGEEIPDPPLLAESFYPRLHYGWSEVLALRSERFKFIDTPRPELYDLEADPGETRNLVGEKPNVARGMKRTLEELLASQPRSEAAPAPLDAETERRLRALGYLGAAAARTDVARHELPDPKDKIEIIQSIARADRLGSRGQTDEAIDVLREVIAEDPKIVDAYVSLGNKFSTAGRHEEAVAAFRRALELNPDYGLALTNLALAYRRLGRFDESRLGFERVLEQEPGNRQALFNLGEISLFEKDYPKALEFFKRGLEQERESPVFLRQTGIAYYYLGSFEPAERSLRGAAAARQDLESVHYTLALLYEKQERWNEAEAEYLKERRLHPDHLQATFNLARLYGEQERYGEQIRQLEELTGAHPDWAPGYFHLAKAYRDQGQPELFPKALAAVDRGLFLDPSSDFAPLGYFIRAEILDQTGRKEEARQAFEQGRALESANR
jgi:arylsulfatase A-like enzyme/Tfp pilus assembly protein PilF